jgi:hypothetical protein
MKSTNYTITIAILLSSLTAGSALAQRRPPININIRYGTPAIVVTAGYPDANLAISSLRQIDINLYQWWLEREQARYSYQYSGQQADVDRMQNAQNAIVQLQDQYIGVLYNFYTQYHQALAADYASNPANRIYRELWEQTIRSSDYYYTQQYQLYQALRGLAQAKFIGLPPNVVADPQNDPSIDAWLAWLHTI